MTAAYTSAETLLVFRNSQGIESRGTIMKLSREMVVFEVYNPYSIVQLSEVLHDLSIRRGQRLIYQGKAVVSNLLNTGLMLIVSATLVEPWSDLSGLSPGQAMRDEIGAFIEDWMKTNARLRPHYQVAVSNLRNFLEELSRWVQHGEMDAGLAGPTAPAALQREFIHELAQGVCSKLTELFAQFEQTARTIPAEETVIHKSFAQRELHPLMLCSPFVHRTFSKPLGYAGDYEMVNMILRDPAEGQNSYSKLVNIYHLAQGPAAAHRNRITRLVEFLEGEMKRSLAATGRFRCINIGCGPAHEFQDFIARNAHETAIEQCEFTLLDFNAETLAFTRNAIDSLARSHGKHLNITYIHKSIHTLLKESTGRGSPVEAMYDLVYCAGLFDYLSDKVCQRLMHLFYTWLNPAGLVLSTNVHSSNPVRLHMEYLLEWHLVYRDEHQMMTLAPNPATSTISVDSTGINVFLDTRKPAET